MPGAGKTSEALAYYALTHDPNDNIFVVAPKNAFIAWEEEILSCFPNLKREFIRITGGIERITEILSLNPRFVICSYHQLPNILNEVANYILNNPCYLLIDESHRMKRGLEGSRISFLITGSKRGKFTAR